MNIFLINWIYTDLILFGLFRGAFSCDESFYLFLISEFDDI